MKRWSCTLFFIFSLSLFANEETAEKVYSKGAVENQITELVEQSKKHPLDSNKSRKFLSKALLLVKEINNPKLELDVYFNWLTSFVDPNSNNSRPISFESTFERVTFLSNQLKAYETLILAYISKATYYAMQQKYDVEFMANRQALELASTLPTITLSSRERGDLIG